MRFHPRRNMPAGAPDSKSGHPGTTRTVMCVSGPAPNRSLFEPHQALSTSHGCRAKVIQKKKKHAGKTATSWIGECGRPARRHSGSRPNRGLPEVLAASTIRSGETSVIEPFDGGRRKERNRATSARWARRPPMKVRPASSRSSGPAVSPTPNQLAPSPVRKR
jgi:hypothetical protein